MELFVEGFTFREHRVHDRGEFFRDERARNRFPFALLPAVELGFHFREVLDRADRRVVKRDLEIAIPIARALVPRLAARVVRPRHQAAVGVEMADRGKSRDVIDFEQERIRDHPADAGDPHEPLRVGRGEHAIAELVLQPSDLRLEERVLCRLQLRVSLRQFRQGGGRRDVVLLQHCADRPLALQPSTHEQEPRA